MTTEEIEMPAYFAVRLSRRVEIEGHVYLPNGDGRIRHVVDQATLDAMGDAVVSAAPVQ